MKDEKIWHKPKAENVQFQKLHLIVKKPRIFSFTLKANG